MSLRDDFSARCLLPALSTHDETVAGWLRDRLSDLGLSSRTDRLANLILTLPGEPDRSSVMVSAYMD
ncbi:hypothetical protein [Rubellimicrobium rubrum]|uniref:hypothetical protein n=1 Tax=Rubellimicrobium rubrum TaxID=2585369 RepID=UPI001C3F2318|nr:hypothetical protein [Rubellimicrobium rubrum]